MTAAQAHLERKRMFILTILGQRTRLMLNKMIIRLMGGVAVKNPLVRVLPWRRTVLMIVGLPLVISLAAMAFAWPASRIAPRDLPVGIVGTSTASQNAVESLDRGEPGGFDFHLYPDQASARSAIKNRDVYGAFVINPGEVTVLEATAASTSVAQLLGMSGQQLAAHAAKLPARTPAPPAHATSHGSRARKSVAKTVAKVTVNTVDVVPTSADDPRGVVFSAALLPLTICSILIAALVTLSGLHLPGWRRFIDLIVVCAISGLAAYLVTQGILGALPHQHVATWAALSLTMLAVSATSAGLIRIIGHPGLGVSAALMVFVGNPFSGSTSAPELLPKAVDDIGQWLPPGAGANLLRSTAYFDGNGSGGHIAVLTLWSLFGLMSVVFGRRTLTVPGDTLEQDAHEPSDTSAEGPAAAEPVGAFLSSMSEAPVPSPSRALEVGRPHSHARHAAHD
ncbi:MULTISPECIES: ABC transporter permease [unclassified Streptomyces]|uniref:ABC transporter permease n=1 Tax=unclassified Streptomyces TaxID=2593676 RepID=UPI003D8F46A7